MPSETHPKGVASLTASAEELRVDLVRSEQRLNGLKEALAGQVEMLGTTIPVSSLRTEALGNLTQEWAVKRLSNTLRRLVHSLAVIAFRSWVDELSATSSGAGHTPTRLEKI